MSERLPTAGSDDLWGRFNAGEDPEDILASTAAEWADGSPVPGGSSLPPTRHRQSPGGRNPAPHRTPRLWTGLLGEIVAAADPSTEADPVGVLGGLLAGVGVLIGPAPQVRVGNTRHPLTVWPLLFGRTGSGRKGEAGQTASLFLTAAAPEVYSKLTIGGLSSGEGLIERIRDVADQDDSGGTEDKRLLIEEPEFASVMARARREGNTLAAVMRQAWDGRALSVLNRNHLRASGSHIAIIGHVTPREFRMRLAETEMAGGSYNRFLPLYVERSKRLPFPGGVAEDVVTDLGKRLADAIAEAARAVRQVGFTGPAAALWRDDLYDEMTTSDDEDAAWTEFTRRAAPYCLRIAALYAVLDGQHVIGETHLSAAAELVRYAIVSAKHVLDRQYRDPRLDRIAREVRAAGDDGLTRTEVSGLFSRNLSKAALDQLLTQLANEGVVERRRVPTGGRPAEAYVSTKEEERGEQGGGRLSSSFVPPTPLGGDPETDR